MRMYWYLLGAALVVVTVSGCSRGGIPLERQRTSTQDLAISGEVPRVPAGGKRFIRYADLARMQQVAYTVRDDTNFDGPVQLSGVPLDELTSALGVRGGELIAAICSDRYEAHYTANYRAQHHPFLALRMNSQEPGQWPKQDDGVPFGPYLISHASFTPAFHVLAHADEPQIPIAVVELRYYDEGTVRAELRPHGAAPGSPAMLGYEIAMENCLRCHRAGDIGGTKSPYKWAQLSAIARGKPEAFGKWVVRPESVNPEATMPANPSYDAATLAALTAYFQSAGAK